MTSTHFVANSAHTPLPAPAPKPTSLTGQLESLLPVWDEARATVGVWECEPGTFTAFRDGYDEACVIVLGTATITSEDGEVFDVAAGDVLVTPRGWKGTWVVHEPLRKVYTIVR